jgi:TonB-dependent receptor
MPTYIKLQKTLFLSFFLFISFSFFSQTSYGNLKGTVSETSSTIPNAKVNLEGTKFYVTTDLEGNFAFNKIPIGKYTLQITYIGFEPFKKSIEITNNETLDLGKITLSEITTSSDLKEVKIVGLAKNTEAKAINMTMNSTKLVTVVSADAIAKLPNKNAADVVARIPGASMQRNKGEGSMISLRGTPQDWTATFLNGDRLPVADEENVTRSFEFEVLPADMIEYVIVSRTTNPDIEGDNIGGTINFLSRTAVSKKTFRVNSSLGMNPLAGKPTGNFNFLVGNVSKNKKFSYVINGSYYGRYYAADARNIIYGNNYNHSINRLQLKRYDGVRNTFGLNTSLEYKFNSKFKIGTHLMYGAMIDNKYQKMQQFNWYEGSGQRVRLNNINGELNRRIFGGDFYAEYAVNAKLTLKARLAAYDNRFGYGDVPLKNRSKLKSLLNISNDNRNGYYNVEFISPLIQFTDQSVIDLFGNATDPNNTDIFLGKLIGADNPYGVGDNPNNIQPQFSPSLTNGQFNFYQASSQLNDTRESDPLVLQLDGEYKINNALKISVGGKYRDKIGYRHISFHEWYQKFGPNNSTPLNLTDFDLTDFSSNSGGFLRELGATYENQTYSFFTHNQLSSFLSENESKLKEYYMDKLNQRYQLWVGSNYDYHEKQSAGYVMAEYNTAKINLVGGLRVEHTNLIETSDTLTSELLFDAPTSTYYLKPEQRTANINYISFLPSVNLTYHAKKENNLRFAISRTMHRPNFAQTKPGFAVINYYELIQTFGNPNLKPTYSYNFDLFFEHFWASKGMWSVGGFYKNIQDHIFTVGTADVDAETGIQIKRYQNAASAFVVGFEAVFIRKFDFLPGFWKDFGINSNITLSYSQMNIPGRPNSQAMTEQTPLLANIGLNYEKNGFNARLALGYNGKHLKELNLTTVVGIGMIHKDSDYDIFMNDYYNLDFQCSYTFKQKYTIYLEGSNLLNYPMRTYIGKDWRTLRIEYYRPKGQIGFKFDL